MVLHSLSWYHLGGRHSWSYLQQSVRCAKWSIDSSIRDNFKHGQAYGHADVGYRNSFPSEFRPAIVNTYVGALKRVCLIGILFTVVIFIAAFLEKKIVLRTELDTDFGLKDVNKGKAEE
jgi:hypothetical protein